MDPASSSVGFPLSGNPQSPQNPPLLHPPSGGISPSENPPIHSKLATVQSLILRRTLLQWTADLCHLRERLERGDDKVVPR
ncbi:hypothetical protein MA16_Dca027730 [Dendrobium catenatum]|uniref:Uncharacterized protein n=1 Tax=Dendrobium catenatum TaxID=906689 RepID=A0A2I0V986_9ASPA|nr:hypothetical protein MA16_Dca027730 [Dendrobium catenatum]